MGATSRQGAGPLAEETLRASPQGALARLHGGVRNGRREHVIAMPLRHVHRDHQSRDALPAEVVVVAVRAGRGPSVRGVGRWRWRRSTSSSFRPTSPSRSRDTEYLLTFASHAGGALTVTPPDCGHALPGARTRYRERRARRAVRDEPRAFRRAARRSRSWRSPCSTFRACSRHRRRVLLPEDNGKLAYPEGERPGELREADLSVAQWVYDREQPAGLEQARSPAHASTTSRCAHRCGRAACSP